MATKKDDKTKKWFYYGSYLNEEGKRTQYKKRGFRTKHEAMLAEADFLEEIQLNQTKIKLNKLIKHYLKYYEGRQKESTHLKDLSLVKKWEERFGNRWVDELNRKELQDFIDEMDSKYSKRYVEKIYYVGNKIFNFGIKHEYIDTNPLKSVDRNDRPNELKQEMLFWEKEDFDKFIDVVDDIKWKAFFETLYYMGVRKGEAIALQWKDIDFSKKTMDISKTSGVKERTKKVKYTTPKTHNSYRKITIPDVLIKSLKEWYEVSKNFTTFNKEDSFVFGNDLPLPAETIRRKFDRYIDLANSGLTEYEQIKRIRIHDLRHSHASYLINNMNEGFTDFDIAKRLGDTVETLHNTYAHWFKRKDENIVKFMNNESNINIDKDKLLVALSKAGINLSDVIKS